jgi:hypothetical protein
MAEDLDLDLRHWRRMPETQWVLQELKRQFNLEAVTTWASVETVESLYRLKGRREVFLALETLLTLDKPDE